MPKLEVVLDCMKALPLHVKLPVDFTDEHLRAALDDLELPHENLEVQWHDEELRNAGRLVSGGEVVGTLTIRF